MTTLETSYQPLLSYDNDAETPQEHELMIHVVPESSKSRWNHIENLDEFFTRVYEYHQQHGFSVIALNKLCQLMQIPFMVIFIWFLFSCVDYDMLFRNKPLNGTQKVTILDTIFSPNECYKRTTGFLWIIIVIAIIFFLFRTIKYIYHLYQFAEIKAFYSQALKISEADLSNTTWHEIQQRMKEVQKEQQMCIHKQELTELDIYHRILRYKNYMVAMVNKNILPVKLYVPLVGEIVFLTKGMMYNLEFILFYGLYAVFENHWHIKEDFKKYSKRQELKEKLAHAILIVGIINLLFSPLVFLWQFLYFFFIYGEVIKREPAFLGLRRWSMYGKLYLRHFNELDHELEARLIRAYKPATKYMSIFSSHLVAAIARNVQFMAGSVFVVLVCLSVYDEDVIQVEHLLTITTVLGLVVALSRACIPDENLVWCPEKRMMNVVAEIHYIPDSWKGNAHTTQVRNEFAQVFQYTIVHVVEELVSPIVTPLVMIFYLRHKSLDIVDFFRNFTVEVQGVGDVCSFAQMDIRKHGNPQWQDNVKTEASQYEQGEDGKVELSLMHFILTNPEWKPPAECSMFINDIKEQVQRDAAMLYTMPLDNPLYESLHSLSSLGHEYNTLVTSILQPSFSRQNTVDRSCVTMNVTSMRSGMYSPHVKGNVSQAEGPVSGLYNGVLSSLYPMAERNLDNASSEVAAADMALSTLYMHELHKRRVRSRLEDIQARAMWQRPSQNMPHIKESPLEDDSERQPLVVTKSRLVQSS